MDIARPSQAKAKLKKRILIGSRRAALVGITVILARLKPAVPTVDRSLVWTDTVKRGPMVRQVHGPGTLVPVDIRWIAARTQGRVEQDRPPAGRHRRAGQHHHGPQQPRRDAGGDRHGVAAQGRRGRASQP
jgi:multidrug efflux pump subunit AcrA (membrane-fusion protein)